MNSKRLWILTGVALLFLVGLTYFVVVIYIPAQQPPPGPESGLGTAQLPTEIHEAQNKARFVTLIIVMIAGILASYLFEAAKRSGPTIDLPDELGKMLTSSRLIMALVVSPIIFNSIYIGIGVNPQTAGDYLLAFQNGFFWESILSGFSRQY